MTLKNGHKQAQILEILLNSTSRRRVLRFVRTNLASFNKTNKKRAKFFIVTPNPEIVIEAQKDRQLAKILNSADLSLPDGIGLAQAATFLQMARPKNRLLKLFALIFQGAIVGLATFFNRRWLLGTLNLIKGREMFLDLLKLANKKGWRVFLLGGRGVSEKTAKTLRTGLKKVKIAFNDGPEMDKEAKPIKKEDVLKEKNVIDEINKFRPHLLFIAFGAPKQEKWLFKWLPKLNIGGAMVVGGAFDYISGRTNLPPGWVENLGLEWLWRLVNQPWRLKRVLTAFPYFPLKVFWYKLNKNTP